MKKVLPYVYRCEHKETGEFYIGYRRGNLVSANMDFGVYYFTSCPRVQNTFKEFKFEILSEFKFWKTAYEVEQSLIYQSRNNPLLINKNYKKSKLLKLPKENNLSSIKFQKILLPNSIRCSPTISLPVNLKIKTIDVENKIKRKSSNKKKRKSRFISRIKKASIFKR